MFVLRTYSSYKINEAQYKVISIVRQKCKTRYEAQVAHPFI